MTPSTPDKLNEELQEKLKLVLTEFYGEHYCGRCEDYHGLMEEDEEDLGRTISAITTAYAEAIRSAVPEKSPLNMDTVNHGIVEPGSFQHGYMAGRNEVIHTLISNLTEQGILPVKGVKK